MNEENQSSPLDVSDLDNMMRAVKHAHTRGAYTMEEVAQLFPVVQRVEAWLVAYQKQLEIAEVAKTMPMPKEETSEVEEKPKLPPTQLIKEGGRPKKKQKK